MICQTPQNDTIHKSRFSLSLHSNSPISDLSKRHTISSYNHDKKVFPLDATTTSTIKCRTMLESGINNQNEHQQQQPNNNNKKDNLYNHQHWEKIESYYVNRLDALSKEIETSTLQNTKLSVARDELLQEILKLHQKSIELNNKNESLIRSIAEKENHISAFMYNEQQQNNSNHQNSSSVIGVTLIDQPYTLPTPPIIVEESTSSSIVNNSNKSSNAPTKKENQPGIFRQISLRLSSRKRRQQDDSGNTSNSTPLNISEPVNTTTPSTDAAIPVVSSSEPLLHPAAVVTSLTSPLAEAERRYHQHIIDNNNNNSNNNKRKKNLAFGNDLIQQARSENSVIPNVVLKCIREVESRGLSVEGIYRKSGTFGQVKDLQDAFDENKSPKLSKYQDINVITSLLKLYFRELSAPLIPNEFILSQSLSPQERLNQTYALLHNMPIERYCTIKFLVQHLKRVHQNQAINRMPSKNLAVVFGPTLMRFTAGNEEQQMRDMINTVDFIILQSHNLFADYS